MAHAQFLKNQRVYVRPVGTWALVERVVPHWTKGLDAPIRISYDVGLGREFSADELQAEDAPESVDEHGDVWRIVRARNKWQPDSETASHPHPGTHPVVVTSEADWGGWRLPGAEYALSPARAERQASMIVAAPRLAAVAKALLAWGQEQPGAVPEALKSVLRQAEDAVAALDTGTE
jgi:hypothetical protein